MTLLTKLINAVSTGCLACAGHDKLVRGLLAGPTLLLAILIGSGTANAAVPCRTSGSFDSWLTAFEREAMAQGVSQRAVSAAAPGLTYDQRIVNIDRGQRVFTQTFLEFSHRMAAGYRIQTGAAKIKTYAQVFQRIDQQYGAPAPVIVAFWALESDFGANTGKEHTLSALASLAYDCRRAERFRGQLLDALRLIDRGDLQAQDMIGSWAGELGQTQMMPSEYYQYAVDYDGDGKRNLLRSAPDVLGSTANYLVGLGWKRGEPWLTEVRVPASMPWDQADLAIQLPRSKWAAYGVTLDDGRPLPADAMPASLLLPVGRFGPAFLVYQNFQIYLQWNNSLVYSTTAAYLASRIAGAPPLHRGTPPPALPFNEVKEMQNLLVRAGYDVGTVDGFLGLKTRQAVKAMQMKYALPADSYPTAELLARMRS
jgi:lytic murein transglycosylase